MIKRFYILLLAIVASVGMMNAKVTWNSSNISDLQVYGTSQSYSKESVTLSANADMIDAWWQGYGDESHDGISFNAHATGGYTFSNTLGKNFTKIVMTLTGPGGWDMANLGSGWSYYWDYEKDLTTVTWTGNASTVDLAKDESDLHGENVKSIVFYFEGDSEAPDPTYTVALKAGTANADKVTLSATSAVEGATVTVTPDEEYEITAFNAYYVVVDGQLGTIYNIDATLDPGTGAYSFTMPAYAVTIEATIALKPVPEGDIYAGFTATAGSGGFDNEGSANLVDNKFISSDWTKWCTNDGHKSVPTGESESCWWIDFEASAALYPTGYILTTGNDTGSEHGRNPKNWVLKAKLNAGDAWTTIATVTNDVTMKNKSFKDYKFFVDQSGSYKYFRFEVFANQGASVMQLCQLRLIGTDTPAPAPAPAPAATDLASITGDYTAQDGEILTGTLGVNVKISIADGAKVTLLNANINGDKTWTTGEYAGITCLGDATITIVGKNSVSGFYADELGNGYPGIYVPSGKTLIINGTGSLTAQSSTEEAAGIGARKDMSCGNIEIQSGKITAIASGEYGAGIGGAYNANCGDITISGGIVTAVGGDHCAGIGGGRRGASTNAGHCGNILISGGVVSATSGKHAAAIGGGRGNNNNYKTNCGTITITNTALKVYAEQGGDKGSTNTIGAAKYGNCGAVEIGGNTGVINADPYTYRTKEDGEIVVDYINAIGTVVYTQECKDKIDIARELYDALEDSQKTLVTNYQTLLDAEAAYAALIPQPDPAPATTVTWNSSNISNLTVNGNSYSKEGVTLSPNASNNYAYWLDYGDESQNGVAFYVNATGGHTFSNSLGKNFTKIEMTLNGSTGWYVAYLGSGWNIDGMKVIWTGNASTVDLLTETSSFGGAATVKSIVFYFEGGSEPAPANSCGGGLTWELNNGELVISYDGEGTGVMNDYDIPNDNSAPWYANRENITSVSLPEGIKTIGKDAFRDCVNLTTVTIPNSVTTIGESAFVTVEHLETVTIGTGITSIVNGAFYGNAELTTVTCSATTPPSIGEMVFGSCPNLEHIYVPAESVDAYKTAWSAYTSLISAAGGGSAPAGNVVIWNMSMDAVNGVVEQNETKEVFGGITLAVGAWRTFQMNGNVNALLFAFNSKAQEGFTFANTLGVNFKKIVLSGAANTFDGKESTGWVINEDKSTITWEGDAASVSIWETLNIVGPVIVNEVEFTLEGGGSTDVIPCTAEDLGKVLCTDGSIYATVSEATAASKTAVAMIAYVDTENGKALALALADDGGEMEWAPAKTTAAAHTPAVSGGTWTLASKDDWNNMITAAGGYEALRDGFSAVGGTNMQQDAYWSSTPENDNAWIFYFAYGGKWVDGYVDDPSYVRACLAFDIPAAPAAPAYETVMNLINEIPNPVVLTAECKAKIDAARAAFIALSDGDKDLVTNIATLTTAEAAFENVMDIWLSGDCDVILWSDTTLTVRKHAGEGNGAMADYDYMDRAPWYSNHWYDPKPNDIVIKSVTIEEGVTHLGDYAFAWMSEMKTVTIPSSVTTIPEDAFYWSQAVDDIYLHTNPSDLMWMQPTSADVQFKPSKGTNAHVPVDLLPVYQEWFKGLNLTYVGDQTPTVLTLEVGRIFNDSDEVYIGPDTTYIQFNCFASGRYFFGKGTFKIIGTEYVPGEVFGIKFEPKSLSYCFMKYYSNGNTSVSFGTNCCTTAIPTQMTVVSGDGTKANPFLIEPNTKGECVQAEMTTLPQAVSEITYDGEPHPLIAAGISNYGTVQYSIDNGASWSADLPQGINPVTYTIHYRVIGGNSCILGIDYDPNNKVTASIVAPAVENVKAKIAAIPQPVVYTPACEEAIAEARSAYDALDDNLKPFVENYDVLTAAETTYANLKDVVVVEAKINAIPQPVDLKLATRDSIESARAAYEALNAEQKALVPAADLQTLLDAEADLASLNPGGSAPVDIVWDGNTGIANVDPNTTSPAYEGMTVTVGNGSSFSTYQSRLYFTFYSQPNGGYIFANADGTNITKVVIESTTALTSTMTEVDRMGSGWVISNENKTATWTGNADSVSIWKGQSFTNYWVVDTITFTVNGVGATPLDSAQAVKDLIEVIPMPVTLEDACVKAIEDARAAYDALSEAAQGALDPADVKKLTDAEAALTALNQAEADKVVAKINNIPQPVELKLATRDSIESARAAYDALNAAQQALVTNYTKLTDAEDALAALNPGVPPAAPLDSAQAVKDLIDAISTPVEYPTSGPAIAAALVAYQQLSDAAKGALDAADVQKMTDAATQYAALDAIAAIDDIPAEIVYDPLVKAAIETAREKYDALIDASKALVDDEVVAKLTNAEKAWADLVAKVEHNVSYIGKDGELKNEIVALLHIPDPAPDFNGYEFVRWDVKGSDFLEEGLRVKAVYTPIITTNPQGFDTLAYNGLAQELVAAGVAKEGHIEYSLYPEESESWSAALPKATIAGVYAIYYKLVREGHADYIAPEPTMATIAKVPVTYVAPVAYDTLVYTASNQTLIAAGQTNDGTFEYSLNPTLPDSWNTELPQAMSAGTYNVYYRVQGDLNHLDSVAATPVAVTIAKAELTATADNKAIIFGELAPQFTVTYAGWQGDDDASVLTGDIAFACEYVRGNNVGAYTITPSGVDAANYAITFVDGTLTVNRKSAKSADITAAQLLDENLVYTNAVNRPTIVVMDTALQLTEVKDYTLSFVGRGETQYAESATAPIHVGDYTAIVAFVGNYKDTLTVDFTISKAPLTITAENKEVIFGENAPVFTVAYTGFLGTDTATVLTGTQAYACEYVRGDNVGDYTIIPSGVDAHDYAITFANGTLTVNCKSAKSADIVAAQLAGEKLIYTNAVNRPTIVVTDTTLQLTETKDYTLSFMGTQADNTQYAESATAPIHVGNYTAIVAFIGNYKDTLTVDFMINQAPLTITANDTAMIYGDIAPEFTVRYDGFLGTDDNSVLLGTQAYDCIYAPGSPIGTYAITPKDVDAYDYAITFVDGTLTVNKAHVYVSDAEAQIAKFADGHANAVVLKQGVLNGIKLNDPIAHVTTAAFSSADVAENLTITLFYELTGDAALLKNYNLDPTSDIFTTEGVIIEPFIPDDQPEEKEDEEAKVEEGIEIYAYGYCDGSGYSLKYHLESGNPDQYKIDFADSRFTDVDWTNLVITGKDGTIDIDIPVDLPTGDYTMTVYFRDSRFDWLESRQFNVTFHVNLPETYVRPLFDNVIALVDTCNCLTDIQWYWRANSTDTWVAIPGANGYYYHSDTKLAGEYFVSAKMNGEPTYTCGQADMETLYGDDNKQQNVQVKAYPNPVVTTTTVTIEGSENFDHNLRVVNLTGVEVLNTTFEGNETTVDMNGYVTGNYMISVDGIVVKVMKK